MAGQQAELLNAGFSPSSGDHQLRLGHVKIMLTMSTGELHPNVKQFSDISTEAVRCGFPIAVHCIEQESIEYAAQVITDLPSLPLGTPCHRIEHCSECPPDVLDAVRKQQRHSIAATGTERPKPACDAARSTIQVRVADDLVPEYECRTIVVAAQCGDQELADHRCLRSFVRRGPCQGN